MCGPVSITQVEHVMLSLISKTFWASPDIGTKETRTKDTTLGTARIHPLVVVVVAVRSLAGDDEVIPNLTIPPCDRAHRQAGASASS